MEWAVKVIDYNRRYKKWTKQDVDNLTFWWDVFTMDTIATNLGRTPRSIRKKAIQLHLAGRCGDYVTLNKLILITGYSRAKLKNVARRIGVELQRRPAYFRTKNPSRHGSFRYMISLDDVDEIIATLKRDNKFRLHDTVTGEWGTGGKPDVCIECGTSERPYAGRGYCKRCLNRIHSRIRRKRIRDSKNFSLNMMAL